jgi:hypothetical protein
MDALSQIRQLVAQGYSPEAAAAVVSRQSGGNTAAPSAGDVDAAIRATAGKAGMDVPTWRAIAQIESSLNPGSNANRSTQYKGLYQIGSRGAGSEWATHGSGNIYNAMDNAQAAANLAADNNSWFQNKYGRAPTPTETYMMHQQGRGFYQNGTMTNVGGNPYPGMSGPQTPQSFEAGWGREIARRAGLPYDPNAPSVAGTSGGGDGGGGGGSGGAVAGPAGTSTTQASAVTPSTGDGDSTNALAGIAKMLQTQQQANAPPPLQPIQFPSAVTPAMLRARQYAQAMINQPLTNQTQPPATGTTP